MFSNHSLILFRKAVGLTLKTTTLRKSLVRCLNTRSCIGSESAFQTVDDVKDKLRKIMGVQQGYQPIQKSRAHLLELLPNSQDDLPPRSIKDSYDMAVIPLSKNVALQDKYVTFMGTVRFGRLMEDLDMFAVNIIFKHLLNPKQKEGGVSPAVIATVLVDEISISNISAKHNEDIRIHGYVSWVGTSSAEVTVWLEQCLHGAWFEITRAIFVMVARNSTNTKSTFLNKLVPADDEEKKIIAEAEERASKRKKEGMVSLLKEPPNSEEQHLIHKVFVKSSDLQDITLNRRVLPADGGVWMNDTKMQNSLISQPEDRNLHNKIFGGFLMRNSLELAYITAFVHSKQRPMLRYSSGITFNHPVDVGTFIRMTGVVAYTNKQFMQITVYNELHDPFIKKQMTTNVFNYTYESNNYVLPVIPRTYSEAMMYIDGRRHFNNSIKY